MAILTNRNDRSIDSVRTLVAALVVMALSLGAFADPSASTAGTKFRPDPKTQRMMQRVANAQTLLEVCKLLSPMRRLKPKERRRLIVEAVYFSSQADDVREAMGPAILFRFLNIGDGEIIVALLPFLTADDLKFRKDVQQHIRDLEPGLRDQGKRFEYLSALIKSSSRKSQWPDRSLVQFIFAQRPAISLRSMASAYLTGDLSKWRRIEWSAHVTADAIWRKRYRHTEPVFEQRFQEVLPGVRKHLSTLSSYDEWWVRLYAAEIANRHPELANDEIIRRLKRDKHELVRNAVNRSKTTGKRPPSKRKRGTRPSNGKHSSKSTVKPRKTKRRFPPC